MRLRPSSLALPLLFALACGRGSATVSPSVSDEGRGQDARTLPGFGPTKGEASADEVERYHVPLDDAPVQGRSDAAITVVMFSDFECPYCQRGYEIVGQLRRQYGGALRVAYKAFPLDMHPHALLAAMAARSAQAQGKFWDFHDRLYSQDGLDVDTLFGHARAAGMDLEALGRDLERLEYGPEVSRDLRLGRRLGVHSTPTFFVNGRMLTGAQPIDAFEAVIDDELRRAEEWREQGIEAEGIYAHAIADGYRKVVYTDDRQADPDAVYAVPLGDSPRLGPDDAPVTIVSFGDFECPYCVRGAATIDALREHYGDAIRVVHKHSPLPFHSHAYLAARATVAAQRQGKFWAFHDALYARGARFDEDELTAIAKEVGLDMKAYRKAMSSLELDAAIEQDMNLAMNLGVNGTPAYFVNGRPVHGAQPELVFRLLIEEELERAAAARARGVAPGELYEALTHTPLDDAALE